MEMRVWIPVVLAAMTLAAAVLICRAGDVRWDAHDGKGGEDDERDCGDDGRG